MGLTTNQKREDIKKYKTNSADKHIKNMHAF